METVINAANGAARMNNKICSRSLMFGSSHGHGIIDAETVRIAVEDNQLG